VQPLSVTERLRRIERRLPSTLTNGQEVIEVFQQKCFMPIAFFDFVRQTLSWLKEEANIGNN